MLYKGSEMMREVAWVIYDEVHYMRDKERGVVWEESIILLPHKVRFVFLSATIPNANEFVSWVSKLHHQPCHVVYTDYRPVPLQHFLFPAGSEGLFLVVDEKGKFREENFQKAMICLQGDTSQELGLNGSDNSKKRKQPSKNMNSDLFKIVKLIMERSLDPCIIFSFSKKDCESYALQMARMDFNSEDDKSLVEQVFSNAIEALSEDDKCLPQVLTILPLLKRGVGIHHGGLLPILKEVIEILFQEGLIKCLFATETFSIGINMPAKTVVFTQTRKFDGKDFRWITSGEYIQMSGRAGRRGKDDRGIVIQMLDEKMEPDIAKNMIYGASDPLFSSYHVGYNMVLNMLRVEDANPENLIRSSFHQFQQELSAPLLEKQADELVTEAGFIQVDEENAVSEYHSWLEMSRTVSRELNAGVMRPLYCVPFLQVGRMVHVQSGDVMWGWGCIVNFRSSKFNRKSPSSGGGEQQQQRQIGSQDDDWSHVLDVLLEVRPSADGGFSSCLGCGGDGNIGEVLEVSLSSITALSAVRLTIAKDLTSASSRLGVMKAVREVCRRFEGEKGVPLLDAVADMAVPNELVEDLLFRHKELNDRMAASPVHTQADAKSVLAAYKVKARLMEEARLCRLGARESQSVAMREQLHAMKRVLRKFEYITAEGVLCVKGKFSCELSAADELVLTNMVFDGIFGGFSIEQTVALLSCFVHKEASKETSSLKIRGDMQTPFRQLQSAARNVAKACSEAKITTDEDEYVASFNPGLVDVTFAWCAGAKFVDVCKLTEVFEGSIVRVLRRLEELLRQLAAAALAIGNSELMTMFEEGSKKIRRGVVFTSSLYM